MSRPFKPTQDTIVAKPYIGKNKTFTSSKESAGDIQISEVIAVGSSYIDTGGIKREAPCKKGDIIIHEYTSNTGDVDFNEYRFVKFHQVLSIYGKEK